MLASSKLSKISKEVSNFIVAQVLDRADILIRNSYRRLTAENETRNEQWQQISEEVVNNFDIPIDADKVKSHFHNRKKVLLARMKESLRLCQNLSIDEKMEEICRKIMFQNENDVKLARICLEVEEEEKLRIDAPSDETAMWNRLLEQTISSPLSMDAPILSKMLAEPTSSRKRGIDTKPTTHLIVDVTSNSELKRLLCVLIDNGFYRFQHVENLKQDQKSVPDVFTEIQKSSVEQVNVDIKLEDDFEEDYGVREGNSEELNNEEDVENNLIDEEEDVKSRLLSLFESKRDEPVVPPNSKRQKTTSTITNAQCEMCESVIRMNTGGSKWNLYEHVILKHSTYRPFKCTECSYEATRKIRVRQHAFSQHNMEIEPLDMTNPEIRKEWLQIMSECFPQHQYGKNTIASKCQ